MQKQDAFRLRDTLKKHGVEYMLLGKGAAVLQGYSGTTQDIDIYPSTEPKNKTQLLAALRELGFEFDKVIDGVLHYPAKEVLEGKDFIQLKGPFELDIVFAPDGFESYEEALPLKRIVEGFPVLSIEGIIRTKEAAGRKKDLNDIGDLKLFAEWLRRKERGCAED